MGQQYSFAVKALHEHALVLKDLAVLDHQRLSSKLMSFTVRKLYEMYLILARYLMSFCLLFPYFLCFS